MRGDRIKNDRRDAVTLTGLLRSGELTAISAPDEDHEAMRDLVRARRQAKDDLAAVRQMLLGFLLRHGRRQTGKSNWTRLHWRSLGEQASARPTSNSSLANAYGGSKKREPDVTAWTRCSWRQWKVGR
nr:transposase [Brucella tritici]